MAFNTLTRLLFPLFLKAHAQRSSALHRRTFVCLRAQAAPRTLRSSTSTGYSRSAPRRRRVYGQFASSLLRETGHHLCTAHPGAGLSSPVPDITPPVHGSAPVARLRAPTARAGASNQYNCPAWTSALAFLAGLDNVFDQGRCDVGRRENALRVRSRSPHDAT